MAYSNTVTIIKVDPKFARKLKDSWRDFNKYISTYYGREITFRDYTRILADIWDGIADALIAKAVFLPVKKGRKSKRLTFDVLFF